MLLFRVIRRDISWHSFHLKCPQYVYAQITQGCTAGITPSYLEFILRILCSSFFLPIPIHDEQDHSVPNNHNRCLWGRLLSMCHTVYSLHRPRGRPLRSQSANARCLRDNHVSETQHVAEQKQYEVFNSVLSQMIQRGRTLCDIHTSFICYRIGHCGSPQLHIALASTPL